MTRRRMTFGALAAVAALSVAAIGAGVLAAPPDEGTPFRFESWLPARTVAVAAVPDLEAATKGFTATDLGKMWAELKPFFDAISTGLEQQAGELKAEFEQNTGLKLDDVLTALSGGFAVALVDIQPEPGADEGGMPFAAALALNARGADRTKAVETVLAGVRKLAAGGGEGAPPGGDGAAAPVRFDIQGIQVEQVGGGRDMPPFLAFKAGDVFVFTTSKTLAGEIIGASKGAAQGPTLGADPDFKAFQGHAVKGQAPLFYAYGNLGPVMQMASQENEEVAKVLYKTGLRELKGIGLGLSFHEGKIHQALVVRAPGGERRGVLSMLDRGPADLSGAKWAPKDTIAFSAVKFDLKATFDKIVDLFTALEPEGAKEFQDQLAKVEKQFGVKLREDLLASIGADWTAFSFHPTAAPNAAVLLPQSVKVIALRDPARFQQAVNRLFVDAFHMESKSVNYEGKLIRYFAAPLGRLGENPFEGREPPPGLVVSFILSFIGSSYVVEGDKLFLADMPQTLMEYYDAVKASGGATLEQNESFKAELARAPKGVSSFSYMDPRTTIGGGYQLVVKIAHLFEGIARLAGVPVDTALLPRAKSLARLATPGAAWDFADKDGFVFEARSGISAVVGPALAVPIAGIAAAVAIPNLIRARQDANEASAIGALRTISTAQAMYREGDKEGDKVLDYAPTLQELGQQMLIDAVLGSGTKQGYVFRIVAADQYTWSATAEPAEPGKTGERFFFVDESGVIRQNYYMPADPTSPPIGW